MATSETRVVAVRNGIALKYLTGMVKMRTTGNIRMLIALKQQIERAKGSPRRIGLAQKKVLKPMGISKMPTTVKLRRNNGLIWA